MLVFDEAHHCLKNHPYNLIMSEFYHRQIMDKPRIFGMTASPIGNQKSAKIIT